MTRVLSHYLALTQFTHLFGPQAPEATLLQPWVVQNLKDPAQERYFLCIWMVRVATQYICGKYLSSVFEVKYKLTCRYTCNFHVAFMLTKSRCAGYFPFTPISILCPPTLCPGKLFPTHLSDSFILWLLLRFGQWESSAENGSQEGEKDGVFTPSHTYHGSMPLTDPPWIGWLLCGSGNNLHPPPPPPPQA